MTNIEKPPNEDIYNDTLAQKGVRFLSQSRRLRKRLDELNQGRPKEQGSRVGCPHAGMICFAMEREKTTGEYQAEYNERTCSPWG
jgi:hypothetical protein